jgi:hypothetical protein
MKGDVGRPSSHKMSQSVVPKKTFNGCFTADLVGFQPDNNEETMKIIKETKK